MHFYRITYKNGKIENGEGDNLRVLHSELDNRAVVSYDMEHHHNFRGSGSDWVKANMFVRDNAETDDGVRELAVKAADVWNITGYDSVDISMMSLTEETLPSVGFRFSRKSTAFDKAGIRDLTELLRERDSVTDYQFNDVLGEQRASEAKDSAYAKTLVPELDRIRKTKAVGSDFATPAHYIVQGNGRVDLMPAIEILLGELEAAGRLPSKHVFKFDLDRLRISRPGTLTERDTILNYFSPALAQAVSGNAIIIQYGMHDFDGKYDMLTRVYLDKMIKVLRPYMEDSLIVFCIPEGNDDLLALLKRDVDFPLVTISPDGPADATTMSRDEALEHLERMARLNDVEVDQDLVDMVDECLADKSFSDLEGLFSDWRHSSNIKTNFPDYAPEMHDVMSRRGQQEPDAMSELDELIGLDEVKQHIKDVLRRIKMNDELACRGLPRHKFSLHMAFMGEPGTGKTIVAQLYGRILKEAGILSEGRVITVSGSNPGDIDELFDRARGSVLFFDEAYALLQKPASLIASIIARMESDRNETVVILAGYEGAMNMLFSANPGFRSRIGFFMHFPSYTPDEMLDIFKLMCRQHKSKPTEDALRDARDLFARNGRRIDQGNGRYVRKMFEDTVGAQQLRLARALADGKQETADEDFQVILPCDIAGRRGADDDEETGEERLESLIGLDGVKKVVRDRVDFMRLCRLRRDRGLDSEFIPMHMAFLGSPGTGKTEVARVLGKILNEKGVLSVGDFIECKGSDLVCGVSGEADELVNSLFQKARGSVIFIDEAYSLAGNTQAGQEAIAAIITNMENYRDEVIVIFAGYTREIENLFRSNPGFASRVRTMIDFPDYSADELVQIFEFMVRQKNLRAGKKVLQRVREAVEKASKQRDFGNARFVRNLLDEARLAQSARLAKKLGDADDSTITNRELSTLRPEDIVWEPRANTSGRGVGFGFALE